MGTVACIYARNPYAGRFAVAVGVLWLNDRAFCTLAGAHGRCLLPRESLGVMSRHSLRALSKRERDAGQPVYPLLENEIKN